MPMIRPGAASHLAHLEDRRVPPEGSRRRSAHAATGAAAGSSLTSSRSTVSGDCTGAGPIGPRRLLPGHGARHVGARAPRLGAHCSPA
jgi:hypothetical protein